MSGTEGLEVDHYGCGGMIKVRKLRYGVRKVLE